MARDWLNSLFKSSFKGVSFWVDRDEEAGGRRVVKHQFPMRDVPFLEDLGEDLREFDITAYVASDNADTDAASVIVQCASRGPGILVLPTHGSILVRCLNFRRERSKDRNGYIALQLRFVRQGAGTALATANSLSNQVFIAADQAALEAASTFAATVSLNRQPDFVVATVIDGLRDSAAALEELRMSVNVEQDANARQRDEIQSIFDDAGTLDADPSAAAQLVVRLIASARALGDAIDPLPAMQAFEQVLADAPRPELATTYRTNSARNAGLNLSSCYMALRIAAAAAYCEAIARIKFSDRPAAITVRANVAEHFDAELNDMPAQFIDLAHALAAMRDRTVDLLSREIIDLAPIITVSANLRMPSLFWAWRIYQDPSRSSELVARNLVAHPSFMPTQFEALAR